MKERKPKGRLLAAGALLCVPLMSALIQGCGGGGSGVSVPPSANDIVFASNFQQDLFDLYTIKSDGSNRQRLTNTPGISEAQPSWRPDKRVVAFDAVAKDSRDWNIYSLNADGSGLKQLTNNPAIDAQAAFSPDGSKIAFTSNRDGQAEIYLMNADGSGLQRLTNDADNDDIDPAWSPDGKQIAFAKGPHGTATLFISVPPTRFVAQRERIAAIGVNTARYDLCVMDANGSNVQRLVINDGANRYPSWNPSGSQILFYHNDGDALRFETISSLGNNRQPFLVGFESQTSFSPMGTDVVAGSYEIYKVSVSDKKIEELTNLHATDSQAVAIDPDWK